jgi:nucleotide-binding universal stress UspA family protein
MITLSRILCPIDLSDFSARALRHAIALAGWYKGAVTALHVRPRPIRPMPWLEYPAALPMETPEQVAQLDEAVRAFVAETAAGAEVQVEIRDGVIVPEIVDKARDMSADLIVMGTHGLGGFERLILGSVAERTLRKAPCPVMTVPHLASADALAVTFKTILCAVDFSRPSMRALEYALSLAQEAGGRLILVHVLEGLPEEEPRYSTHYTAQEFRRIREREARDELVAAIPEEARTWCEAELVIGHGKPYRELLRIAGERRPDLIVLGAQGRGAVDLALFGSTAEHILRQSVCPVLTVPRLAKAAAAAA